MMISTLTRLVPKNPNTCHRIISTLNQLSGVLALPVARLSTQPNAYQQLDHITTEKFLRMPNAQVPKSGVEICVGLAEQSINSCASVPVPAMRLTWLLVMTLVVTAALAKDKSKKRERNRNNRRAKTRNNDVLEAREVRAVTCTGLYVFSVTS
ncbi:hypothetical protein MAR_029337 [Mya arenaria]|uniref:Uncharacterized protein n=1 Tax=Mya arenaria TaxID=6604 RepID=A0ABY7DIX2_MYAAR|nr:hypothetical protein MAR_029337 [Mya arenaria]